MKNKLPGRATTYLFLVFLSPLTLGSTAGPAERDAVEVPPNAHLERSGRDWECDRGYRKSGDTCAAVKIHRTPTSTLTATTGTATEVTGRPPTRACLSECLRTLTSTLPDAAGRATRATGESGTTASRTNANEL